jgi:hypothetical protein
MQLVFSVEAPTRTDYTNEHVLLRVTVRDDPPHTHRRAAPGVPGHVVCLRPSHVHCTDTAGTPPSECGHLVDKESVTLYLFLRVVNVPLDVATVDPQ